MNTNRQQKGGTTDKFSAEKTGKYIRYIFIALAVLFVIGICLILVFTYSKEVVASVGNEKITVDEFKFFLKQEKDNMLLIAGIQAGTPEETTFWNSKIDGENALEYAKKKAMESLEELKIQVIKAKEQGIKLTKSDIESLEKNIKAFIEQNDNSTVKANEQSLQLYGVKLNEVKDIYKQLMLMQKLVQKETENMNITEADMENYYNKYPDWFKNTQFRPLGEEAVWARHILIKAAKDQPAEEVEKARKKAEEILQRVKNGEDFVKLVKENSEDTLYAQEGGDYVFSRGTMMAEFENASFSLSPGQVSELVQTDYGFHIIKVEEKYAKDQPVSLRCAKEYREFGVDYIKSKLYEQMLDEWKKDEKFALVKDEKVYSSIK